MQTRKLLFAFLASLATMGAKAESPLWLRNCAISPDGKTIAFNYKGDIFTVGVNGGDARQLTTHSAYDNTPIWSPDSKSIAFASNREGSMDIYVMDANGGFPTRMTTGPQKATPIAFNGNNAILYSSYITPSAESNIFPTSSFQQVYELSWGNTQKGKKASKEAQAPFANKKTKMISSLPMEHISVSKDGNTWLYHDCKGYEDKWRKHHTSSITRDIWSWNKADNKYTKITSFKGEDRDPIWGDNGNIYYLSEENGSFNVYLRKMNDGTTKALTTFKDHPVRFLTRSDNGMFCFSYNGEIYTLKEGEQPKKLEVSITTDCLDKDLVRQTITSGASDIAVSPDGKEIAFIVHGDVYVTSADYRTTRQITNTPGQEREVDFAPDGKSVVYDSERNGLWQIYQTSIEDKDCKSFVRAKKLKEENLTNNNETSFQPLISPDGKSVAYLENRTTLRVLNISSKKIVTVLDGKFNYSYSDGDQSFSWSPDSKWLLTNYIGIGGWNNPDIALVKADGSELHDLTNSGYSDGNAKFVLGGKAMVWESDRAGYRSHGSWGAETDYYIMFFDIEEYDKFRMNKEDLELYEASKTEKEKKKEEKEAEKKEEAKEEGKVEKVKEVELNLKDLEHRIVRLTQSSGNLGDCVLNDKGDKFYYVARDVNGNMDLWEKDLKEGNLNKFITNIGGSNFFIDKDNKNIYYSQWGSIKKLAIGSRDAKNIDFEATFNYRPAEERAYIFDHCWRQVKEKFYDPTIRGIDWQMYHDNYARFLPYINNNYDFAEMLSELLGEVNGSHTGCRYYPSGAPSVGRLGLFYDESYDGKGLMVKEIMPRSPIASKKTDIKAGMVLARVNGIEIEDMASLNEALLNKIGKNVMLTFTNKNGGNEQEVEIKPISSGTENDLIYKRWVERNRKYVEEKTGGKIGYIHIEAMGSASFRVLYSELLGKYRNTEGVIIDTRHNGGGWLHDDVITLLSAKEYAKYTPRGQYIGSDPYNKYTKKSCMLVCEDNYSNAHGTPWLYKELGVGKLIGAPVPGTMTAVWWENQIDNSLTFGIPQVGCQDMKGNYLENMELQPDIVVYNDPADVLQGKDAQLDAAIEEMMKK